MARKKRVVHEDPDVLVPILKDGVLHPTSVMYREVLTEGKRDEAHLKRHKDRYISNGIYIYIYILYHIYLI